MIACAVELEVLDNIERLGAFQAEWQDFLSRFPVPTPFQTPEWLMTWWSHFGSGRPQVFVFRHERENGRREALFPV